MNRNPILSPFIRRFLRHLFCAGGVLLALAGCNTLKINNIILTDDFGRPIEGASVEFKSRASGHPLIDAVAAPTGSDGSARLDGPLHINNYTYVVIKKGGLRKSVDKEGFSFDKPSTLIIRVALIE